MEQSEIIEGNKLIAEFMGVKRIYKGYDIPKYGRLQYSPMAGINDVPDYTTSYSEDELLYHSNWNWLMDVVEKIESMGNHFPIEKNGALVSAPYSKKEEKTGLYCIIQYISASTKIEASWKTVIEFIKWYNLNNNPGQNGTTGNS